MTSVSKLFFSKILVLKPFETETIYSVLLVLVQDLLENIKDSFETDLDMELDTFSQDEEEFVNQVYRGVSTLCELRKKHLFCSQTLKSPPPFADIDETKKVGFFANSRCFFRLCKQKNSFSPDVYGQGSNLPSVVLRI